MAFEPKTSFPCDWRLVLWELDPAADCPALEAGEGCLSLVTEVEAGEDEGCAAFPSSRLPTPVKGLNLGSISTGVSSAA